MCSEQHRTGIIDRIEGGVTVILLDPDESEIAVPTHAVPDGAADGTAVNLTYHGHELMMITVDAQRTQQRRKRIREKLALLRKRGSCH